MKMMDTGRQASSKYRLVLFDLYYFFSGKFDRIFSIFHHTLLDIIHKMTLFFGLNTGGRSFSPSISLMSISTARLICEIGTSLAPPSNGFSVLSPTCSNDVYTQEITTLNGIVNQTMFPFSTP